MSTNFATANLAALKSFLVSADAYVGVSSAMKFDGWRITDVRAYAERVQAVREAGFDRALVPNSIQNAEMQVAGERAAAEAARLVAEATAAELMAQVEAQVQAAAKSKAKRPTPTVATERFVAQMMATLAQATVEGDVLVVGADTLLACGWSKAYTTLRTGWSKNMNGGMAARQLGYAAKTRADATQPGGFVVVLSRAA